jgi:hypothetical protein
VASRKTDTPREGSGRPTKYATVQSVAISFLIARSGSRAN